MVWRISAGLGPEGPEGPEGPAGPAGPEDPAKPGRPLLASVVRRGGGLSRNWGARLACLTRRGRSLNSPLVPGPSGPPDPEGPPGAAGPAGPGVAGSGPVSRESSHGGPEACPARGGEATGFIGVIGVDGPAGAGEPVAAWPPDEPGVLCWVQPGNGVGGPPNGSAPPFAASLAASGWP